MIAGDRVLFDWRAQGGGDDADVFAYLLDENTGNTIQLLDANAPRVGAAPWQSSDVTVMTPGDYKYVFVSGTFDESLVWLLVQVSKLITLGSFKSSTHSS